MADAAPKPEPVESLLDEDDFAVIREENTPSAAWTPREYLQVLATGCPVHGVGFICKHTWDDIEGGDAAMLDEADLNAARVRVAEVALEVLNGD